MRLQNDLTRRDLRQERTKNGEKQKRERRHEGRRTPTHQTDKRGGDEGENYSCEN